MMCKLLFREPTNKAGLLIKSWNDREKIDNLPQNFPGKFFSPFQHQVEKIADDARNQRFVIQSRIYCPQTRNHEHINES